MDYRRERQQRQTVSWEEMVANPKDGALKILSNQIKDRDDFIRAHGLWDEFQRFLSDGNG